MSGFSSWLFSELFPQGREAPPEKIRSFPAMSWAKNWAQGHLAQYIAAMHAMTLMMVCAL